jgi:hypothetical protein
MGLLFLFLVQVAYFGYVSDGMDLLLRLALIEAQKLGFRDLYRLFYLCLSRFVFPLLSGGHDHRLHDKLTCFFF